VTLLQRIRPPAPRRTAQDSRRGERHDVLSARLAELDRIGTVLDDAREVVEHGWVQHAWFAYVDEVGRTRLATAHDLHLMAGRPVTGACLVGAVVLAGGGLQAAGGQLVNRTLDLTWHALRSGREPQVRWCPSPAERAVQTRDLTSWNDARRRTADDVQALLAATGGAALSEAGRVRRERAVL
jgi:hypothetical protein